MSAARELLDRLAAIGATIEPAGDRLILRAGATAVPANLVAHLRQSKGEVLTTLAMVGTGLPDAAPASDARTAWDAVDWRDFFEERAAIRQFDAGYPKATAERLAFCEAVEAWCERHPVPHDPIRCAGCGNALEADALDLPDGARVHAGEGRACLEEYGWRWCQAAADGLAALGIEAPRGREP